MRTLSREFSFFCFEGFGIQQVYGWHPDPLCEKVTSSVGSRRGQAVQGETLSRVCRNSVRSAKSAGQWGGGGFAVPWQRAAFFVYSNGHLAFDSYQYSIDVMWFGVSQRTPAPSY